MSIKIILKGISEDELKGAKFITGFRTLGEVGYIATRYLVLKLGMKRIGFILTKYLRDVTFIDEYGLATPFELFYDNNNNILVLLSHLLPLQREMNIFSAKIIKWLKNIQVSDILLIGGLDKRYKNDSSNLRWLKTSASKIALPYPLMEKQLLIIGPLALFTIYAEIEDLPATVLLPYADRERIDPAAAAIALEEINKLYGLKVDVSELYEDARKIEEELQRQLELVQKELTKEGSNRVYM
ncbi:proteasome assembly chaperone family protein [Sulfolobus sp. S-194]|uniref:proteasome assembly chaperone family protein n=1 Tax=Sulfolobus sp. S-194 TaxID=2512240 RepID=UPI0014370D7E|nr:PAC2 family protein [Sulfolobus sp. S-194]QIW23164.1 proteasome assembly chaperone family protein [Sulfolobus sp. S-194]